MAALLRPYLFGSSGASTPVEAAPLEPPLGSAAGAAADLNSAPALSETQRRDLEQRALRLVAKHEAERGLVAAAGRTLLPAQVAELVSALSILARVSLKSTAFLIEIVLEAAKHGTGMGLGLTRRALITAVGTARAVHSIRGGDEWSFENGEARSTGGDAFLNVLDRYTSLGIYLIHSTFTMAELLAMSSFHLADAGIRGGLAAADESVQLIDGIFGSNETSRALASFITLVRSELTQDAEYAAHTGGSWWGLAALTKALTTFAVLQNATYKRTARAQRMRVVYDCTVLGTAETRSWAAMIVGPGNFVKSGTSAPQRMLESSSPMGSPPLGVPPRASSQFGGGSDMSPSHASSRRMSRNSIHSGFGTVRRSQSIFAGLDEPTALESVEYGEAPGSSSPFQSSIDGSASVLEDLEYLVGTGADDEDSCETFALSASDTGSTIVAGRGALPEDALRAVRGADDDALLEGIALDSPGKDTRRVVRRCAGGTGREEMFEVVTETIEVVETTTTIEASEEPARRRRKGKPNTASPEQGSSRLGRRLANPFSALLNDSRTQQDARSSRLVSEEGPRSQAGDEEEDDGWLEVSHSASASGVQQTALLHGSGEAEMTLRRLLHEDKQRQPLPQPPDRAGQQSIAARARQEALEDPEESRQRMTLRTITRKLVQKRRTVRRVHDFDDAEAGSAATPPQVSPPRSPKTGRRALIERRDSSAPNVLRQQQGRSTSAGSELAEGIQRAFAKAKSSVMGGSSASARVPAKTGASLKEISNLQHSPGPSSGASTPRRVVNERAQPEIPVRAYHRTDGTAAATSAYRHKDLPRPPAHRPQPDPQSRAYPPESSQTRRPRTRSISSVRSITSMSHMRSTTTTTRTEASTQAEGPHGAPGAFPKQRLATNLRRFMRHASASYGQNFMRLLGIGEADVMFTHRQHHPNVYAYCHHVGIPAEHMLLSSYSEGGGVLPFSKALSPIVNFISIDDASRAIVLTCRGTMGLSDILVDLTCLSEDIWVDGGDAKHKYQVHSGMAASARRLATGSTVLETLRQALESRPDYGLVLTGHSLGGGVASLLALLWSSPAHVFHDRSLAQPEDQPRVRHPPIDTPFVTSFDSGLPPGRPIHCYGFGVPAVFSADLSRWSHGLCTSLVHGFDIVPSLSLGVLHDLKAVAKSLSEEDSVMAQEIVGRVIGLYQRQHAGGSKLLGEQSSGTAGTRPSDVPPHERELRLDLRELAEGRTRNRAAEAGYTDPRLSAEPGEGVSTEEQPCPKPGRGGYKSKKADPQTDEELADWLWDLLQTMRADMSNDKLYPPGRVLCIEAFAVYVTAAASSASAPSAYVRADQSSAKRSEAHRVVLRECEDVRLRFGEPLFARSMLRDHTPPAYELCTQLLYDAVVDDAERAQTGARENAGMS